MREAVEQLEVAWCARQLDGVAGALFTQAPPIEDDEDKRVPDGS
jgi:hypothetical protein